MTTTPRVSVIITTHNRAALLVEAVNSVLAQTYQDFELIVADDGSSDDTAARIAALAGSIRYLKLPHSGKPEVARNRAIAQAHGSFFAFLDDDDLWHEEKLARQMEVLEAEQAVGYSYCDCCFLEADGLPSGQTPTPLQTGPPLLLPEQKQSNAVFENLLQGCFVHPSTVVMRRSIFEAVGPFDATFVCQGDYLLWLQAARVAPVACVPEPLVTLRRSPAGLSEQRRLLNLENAILVLEALRRREALTWKQRLLSRRTLARWHVTLGLRRDSARAARSDLLRSLGLNPLQRTAWKALVAGSTRARRDKP